MYLCFIDNTNFLGTRLFPATAITAKIITAIMGGHRGKNFTQPELDSMLNMIDQQLPRGQQDWEEVARLYNESQRLDFHRAGEVLKKKFNRLRSGDPETSPAVARAVALQKKIEDSQRVFESNDQQKESVLAKADASTMLTLVEERLPNTLQQWDELADLYNTRRTGGALQANGKSLKRQFDAFANVQKPTGTPNCPVEVERAKRARYAIQNHAAIVGDEEDDEDDVDGDNGEDREDREDREEGENGENDAGQEEDDAIMLPSPGSPAQLLASQLVVPEFSQMLSDDIFTLPPLPAEERTTASASGSSSSSSTQNTPGPTAAIRKRRATTTTTTTTTTTSASASAAASQTSTPTRQAGLTPQMSASARRRTNIDRAITSLTESTSGAAATATASPMLDLMMAQLQNDREQRRADELRREAERQDERRRYEEEKEDRRRRDEDRREERADERRMQMEMFATIVNALNKSR